MEKKLKLREKVLNNLIDERVLYSAAVTAGIEVSDAELEDALTHDPTFVRDGAFSREIYLRTLELNRITPNAYETMKRRELMTERIIALVTEAVDLSRDELAGLSGDEAVKRELKGLLLKDKKEKALQSFIIGYKKKMDIKVNTDLVLD